MRRTNWIWIYSKRGLLAALARKNLVFSFRECMNGRYLVQLRDTRFI